MYNRYIGNTGRYVREEERLEPPRNNITELRAPEADAGRGAAAAPAPPRAIMKKQPLLKDLSLPFGLDTGDVIILGLLLFLYLESKDEEFLIMLGVLGYALYSEHKGDRGGFLGKLLT
jgi:hypothetical protein